MSFHANSRLIRNRLKNRKGQVAIFIVMMFSLIFMFFGMSINVGMLVHHKINLQNAADMAALAGAAEQARILNMIGWKNFELRKNYKDLMYRYWIAFNDRHPHFPDPRGGYGDITRAARYRDAGTWTNIPGSIPSYCLGDIMGDRARVTKICEITRRTRFLHEVPNVPDWALGTAAIDPLLFINMQAVYQSARARSENVAAQFSDWDNLNRSTLILDASEYLNRSIEIYNTYLNHNRMHSLPEIMNGHGTGITHDWPIAPPVAWDAYASRNIHIGAGARGTYHLSQPMTEMPHDFDAIARLTAKKNLNAAMINNHKFFTLRPLGDEFVKLRPMKIDFTMFWTSFSTPGTYVVPERLMPINVPDFIVGVEKVGGKTFYAVKLDSSPQLPFMPGVAPWKLTAIAAAQPFGSRIGPAFRESDYVKILPAQIMQYIRSKGGIINSPNLPYLMVDEGVSIDNSRILHDLKAVMHLNDIENPGSNRRIAPFLSPSEWEAKRYIFPDPSTTDQRIHWTDRRATISPLGAYPAATNLRTSWGPQGPRAGYSMKLIPVSSIVHRLDPGYLPYVQTIMH